MAQSDSLWSGQWAMTKTSTSTALAGSPMLLLSVTSVVTPDATAEHQFVAELKINMVPEKRTSQNSLNLIPPFPVRTSKVLRYPKTDVTCTHGSLTALGVKKVLRENKLYYYVRPYVQVVELNLQWTRPFLIGRVVELNLQFFPKKRNLKIFRNLDA